MVRLLTIIEYSSFITQFMLMLGCLSKLPSRAKLSKNFYKKTKELNRSKKTRYLFELQLLCGLNNVVEKV